MRPAVRYVTGAGTATITLDWPERRNALGTEVMNGIGDALRQASDDDSVRVLVLTNEGSTFCAGADLKVNGDIPPRYDVIEILKLLIDSPKPVIGRIAGHCIGGGNGLAAACDISIASSDAQFAFTEVRLGVAPAIVSVVCLPKLRRSDALELFLTGDRISANRAAEIGLITRSIPPDQLDDAVATTVDSLLAGGPEALTTCKDLIERVPSMDRDSAFEWTADLSASLLSSEEASEGIQAFREKRPATWTRRLGEKRTS